MNHATTSGSYFTKGLMRLDTSSLFPAALPPVFFDLTGHSPPMALSLAGPSSARSMDPGNSTPPASSAGGRPTVSTPKTAEEA
jgi:hypothetical protein